MTGPPPCPIMPANDVKNTNNIILLKLKHILNVHFYIKIGFKFTFCIFSEPVMRLSLLIIRLSQSSSPNRRGCVKLAPLFQLKHTNKTHHISSATKLTFPLCAHLSTIPRPIPVTVIHPAMIINGGKASGHILYYEILFNFDLL